MIVLIINEDRIAILKGECQPPPLTDTDECPANGLRAGANPNPANSYPIPSLPRSEARAIPYVPLVELRNCVSIRYRKMDFKPF